MEYTLEEKTKPTSKIYTLTKVKYTLLGISHGKTTFTLLKKSKAEKEHTVEKKAQKHHHIGRQLNAGTVRTFGKTKHIRTITLLENLMLAQYALLEKQST